MIFKNKVEHLNYIVNHDESLTIYFTDKSYKQSVVELSVKQTGILKKALEDYCKIIEQKEIE